MSTDAAPASDNYYATHGESIPSDQVPVTKDEAPVEDNIGSSEQANSDAQLVKDDQEAIDQSNVIEERTRGAEPTGSYVEPGDTEGLPEDDGTSSAA